MEYICATNIVYVLFYKILLEVLFPVNSLIGVIGIPIESHNYENSIEVFTVGIHVPPGSI